MVSKAKVKAPRRKVIRTGTPLLKGGEGKSSRISFRGKTYYLYNTAYLRGKSLLDAEGSAAKKIVKELRKDGYKVVLTRSTGPIVNIYTRPEVPEVPHKRFIYG